MTTRLPVVYLPGIDGTGRLLFRQEQLFAEFAVTCVAYPQNDTHTYADLVALGASALEETGPAAVVAESFGGTVALGLALTRPDLVRRLVLVNTFARYPRRLFIDVAGLVGPWLPWAPPTSLTRPVRGYFIFGPGVTEEAKRAWWKHTADVPMRVYGHRCRLIRELDLRPRLSATTTPAVVFAAPNDRVVPAPAGRLLANRLPNARLLHPCATGHSALLDSRINVAVWLKDERLWFRPEDCAQ
jgi:pimeloyl-ACP methyl ester carboxylesterase